MPDFVGINISGIPEIQAKLGQIYPEAADAGVEQADVYIVNSLRAYPPYSYVSMAQVGGFVSDRQRRFVMAMINQGIINPGRSNRTQRLSQGWQTMGSGVGQIVVNEVSYGVYEYEIGQQTQMHFLQGWQVLPEFLSNRNDTIVYYFDVGVKNALHRLGLD